MSQQTSTKFYLKNYDRTNSYDNKQIKKKYLFIFKHNIINLQDIQSA